MKITKARAYELGLVVCKKDCVDCLYCYERHNELICDINGKPISKMESQQYVCPGVDEDRLKTEMTEEEYYAYRHNGLEWE